MIDIVIDTCTLVHADNPNSEYQDASIELISKMLGNTTLLVVDEGFSLDEAINQSYIGLEYIKHLPSGSLGYNLVVALALSGRISFLSNTLPIAKKRYIERIIRNKKDRMFLRVCCNSHEKVLASHDFTDYQAPKRLTIERDLNVDIDIARIINPRL